jgi:hypothetical protein
MGINYQRKPTAPRFAERIRDVPASVPLYAQCAKAPTRAIEVISETCKFTSLPARHAKGLRKSSHRGGACLGATAPYGMKDAGAGRLPIMQAYQPKLYP